MPQVSVTVPHDLGQEEALRRLQTAADALRSASAAQVRDAQDHWDGNTLSFSFSTMGANVHGTLEVGPAEAILAVQIPMMAVMFKGTIQKRMEEELKRLLER